MRMFNRNSEIIDLVEFVNGNNFITVYDEDEISPDDRKNCTECGTIVEKGKQCPNCGVHCYSTTMDTQNIAEGKRKKK